MNLFELNSKLAVKLNQSFNSLYELEYLEYSMYINLLKKEIEEKNESLTQAGEKSPVLVNLPQHLKVK
jgi:hypothetical protein